MAKLKSKINSKYKAAPKRKLVLGGPEQELYLNNNITYQAQDLPTAMLQHQFDAQEQEKAKRMTALYGDQMARQLDYLGDQTAASEKRKQEEAAAVKQKQETEKQKIASTGINALNKIKKDLIEKTVTDASAPNYSQLSNSANIFSNANVAAGASLSPTVGQNVGSSMAYSHPFIASNTPLTSLNYSAAAQPSAVNPIMPAGLNQGIVNPGATVAAKAGVTATSYGSKLANAGVGMGLALAGEAVGYFGNKRDDKLMKQQDRSQYYDDTHYSRAEFNSQIGKSTLKAAGMGSSFGPVGTGIGAAVGAIYGTGKALHERRKTTGKNWFGESNIYDPNKDPTVIEERNREKQLQAMTTTANAMENARMSSMMQSDVNTGFGLKNSTFEAKYGGNIKYLKGGVAKSLGRGAIEYVGKKHEQGGIDLPGNIEVEGGETEQNDYVFSATLKLPNGETYAQTHKNLIKSGATGEEIHQLALSQEVAAGRNPDQIKGMKFAKYGGSLQYDEGGLRERRKKRLTNKFNEEYEARLKEFEALPAAEREAAFNKFMRYAKADTSFVTDYLSRKFTDTDFKSSRRTDKLLALHDAALNFQIKLTTNPSKSLRDAYLQEFYDNQGNVDAESLYGDRDGGTYQQLLGTTAARARYDEQHKQDKEKALAAIPTKGKDVTHLTPKHQINIKSETINKPSAIGVNPMMEGQEVDLGEDNGNTSGLTETFESSDNPADKVTANTAPNGKKIVRSPQENGVPLPKISANVRRPMYPDSRLRMPTQSINNSEVDLGENTGNSEGLEVPTEKDYKLFKDADGNYIYRDAEGTIVASSIDRELARKKLDAHLAGETKQVENAVPVQSPNTSIDASAYKPPVTTQSPNVVTTTPSVATNPTVNNTPVGNQTVANTTNPTTTYTTSDKATANTAPKDNKPRFFMGASRIVDENGNVQILTDRPLMGAGAMSGSRLGTPTAEGLSDVRNNSYAQAAALKINADYANIKDVNSGGLSSSDAVADREKIAGTEWGKRWGYKSGMSAAEAQSAHNAFASEMRTKFDQAPDEMLGYYQYLIDNPNEYGKDAGQIKANLKAKGFIGEDGKIKQEALPYLKTQATNEFVGPIHNAAGAYSLKGRSTPGKIPEETPKNEGTPPPTPPGKSFELPPPIKYDYVPPQSNLGLIQAVPAVYPFLNRVKTKDIAPSLATGYVQPGAVGRVNLGRIQYNAERAANQGNQAAMNQALQNMSGPGAVAGMLAAKTKADQQSMQIAQAEQNTNMGRAGEEAKINAGISQFNVGQAMSAQQTNAQLAQMNAARIQEANKFNTQVRYARDVENREAETAALDRAAQTVAANSIANAKIKADYGLATVQDYSQAFRRYLDQMNKQVEDTPTDTAVVKPAKFGGVKKYISRLGDLKNNRTFKA